MSTTESSPTTKPDTATVASGCPAAQHTPLGPIAPSYDQLHRIDLLARAVAQRSLPQASSMSSVATVLQAAEVGLLNLARMAERTQTALKDGDLARASISVQWMVGFHRLMRSLGDAMFAVRSIWGVDSQGMPAQIGISDTLGYRRFVTSVERLEGCIKSTLLTGRRSEVRAALATHHLDSDLFRVLHDLRIGYHDATKWESDLSGIGIPDQITVNQLLSSDLLVEAVAVTELDPSTFHGEFVALHQIPELLCSQVNDHLEAAVRTLRSDDLGRTVEHLSTCRALLAPVVESQRVMAELLATCEYHEFRENLGPASGIHSLAIKQHMFGDLFKHFWAGVESWLGSLGDPDLAAAVRRVDRQRHDDATAWLRHSALDEAFRLHAAHQAWRHEHLHMPRNCLGAGGTKSMIGVPDGPRAVYKMREAANSDRSLVAIHEARRVGLANAVAGSPLSALVTDRDSVDSQIMRVVGEATRDYFPDVQERSYQPFHSSAPERRP